MKSYSLIDSGEQKKLEEVGGYRLCRPCLQAVWKPTLSSKEWGRVDASFSREKGWEGKLPSSWKLSYYDLFFQIAPTDFGHLGLFPEHGLLWEWLEKKLEKKKLRLLNLFAYSGGASLFAARKGSEVCHVDASKAAVDWARKNGHLNGVDKKIRWIVDDAVKFLKRERTRKSFYDGIILDPPTFGRGSKGEVFKIERDIHLLLSLCAEVLSKEASFVIFSSHTPGWTPQVLHHLLAQFFPKGKIEAGEMLLPSEHSFSLPSGSYARWEHG